MRILLIHQYFVTPLMNGGTRSYEVARRLVKMGHQVEVITSSQTSERARGWVSTIESGVRVHWFSVPYSNHMGFLRRIRAFLLFAFQATRKARKIETDLVYAMSTPLTVAIPAVRASRSKNVPMVFEVGDLWPEVPIAMGILRNPILIAIARSLEKWAYHHAATVIALSPQMKEGVTSVGFPPEKVGVIPNACDFDLFGHSDEAAEEFIRARPYLRGRPIVLYPGTFGAVNGLDYAVDLAWELRRIASPIAFVLVGEGKEKERLKCRAESLGVLGRTLFIEDAVPKTAARGMFSAASCVANFVAPIPALGANSANKFFDALACHKPVLLNFDGWMTDIVRNRDCGIDTSGLEMRDAAELVDSKLRDRVWLAQAGVEAGQVAEQFFSRDMLVTQLDMILKAVIAGKCHLTEGIAPGRY